MPVIDTRTLPIRAPKPGWHGRFFDAHAMSFAYYDIDAGASLHEHAHSNEEVWNVVAGELEMTIGGETFRIAAGSAAIVPPHTAHSVRALLASSVIVVDHPRRAQVAATGRAALGVEFAPGAGLDTPLAVTIRNRGQWAGFIVKLEIERRVDAVLPAPAPTVIPQGHLARQTVIEGGASQTIDTSLAPLTDAERAAVLEGRAVLYVRGAVFYEDTEGERHHTTFCREFDAARGLVPPASAGFNYGD